MSVKKLKVYLCDLTHVGNKIGTNNQPLSIGFLAAYAKKELGDAVEFRLFKYPQKLIEALDEEMPDVIGFSTYVWNDALNAHFCEIVKARSKDTITVLGGPNFPLTENERIAYFREHPNADYFFIYEGEVPFVKFLRRLMEGSLVVGDTVESAACMVEDRLVVGPLLPRMFEMDELPSPYLTGLMDEFFDGQQVPMLETTRGCPFSCKYCNAGYEYYSKTKGFSTERVLAEIRYMAERAGAVGTTYLFVTDMNFGMFARDVDVAKEMIACSKEFNWPQSIAIETGKNRIDNVSKVIEILQDRVDVKLSLQSYTTEVLEEIERKNIDPQSYWHLCNQLKERGRSIIAELIMCLPLERRDTYLEGIRFLMNSNVDRIVNYTLQLNNGTKFTDGEYLRKFGYDTRWRPYANCFGVYDGTVVIEAERVGVATKDLSFDDYVDLRGFAFMVEIVYNSPIYKEIIAFVHEVKKDPFDFVAFCYQHRNDYRDVAKAIDDFLAETRAELFPTREAMTAYFSIPENYDRLLGGELGRNVIFSNFSIVLSTLGEQFTDFVIDMAEKFLGDELSPVMTEALKELRLFMQMKAKGLFEPEARNTEVASFNFDWSAWSASVRITDVRRPATLAFTFTEAQQLERQDNFRRFGTTPAGLAKIIAVSKYDSLFRRVSQAVAV